MVQKDWFASWFDTAFYHDLYAKRNDEEAKSFIDTLLTYFQWGSNDVILDACCGSGRHALYLESKGLHVYGVDLSSNNILQAQSLSQFQDRWMISDVRNFELPQKVDYALNLFTSFGYFEHDAEHIDLLQNINRNVKGDGKLILDFFNVDHIKESLKEEEVVNGKLAEYHIQRSIVANQIIKDIRFQMDGQSMHFQERVMAYSPDVIEEMLSNAGFKVIDVWGDYRGMPFQTSSTRCIFIAQKTSGA